MNTPGDNHENPAKKKICTNCIGEEYLSNIVENDDDVTQCGRVGGRRALP